MAPLSEWLQIMLGEIARKRDESERAREEDVKRSAEKVGNNAAHADVPHATRNA